MNTGGHGFSAADVEDATVTYSAQFELVADELEHKLLEAEVTKPELNDTWRRIRETLKLFRSGEGKRF